MASPMTAVIKSTGFQTPLVNASSSSVACITTLLEQGIAHQPCTLADLLAQVHDNHETCVKERLPAQIHVQNILTTINEHARVIDILIQQQPDITSIVWGAFRFLIGVAVREINTTEKIGKALVDIIRSLGRWEKYIEIFDEYERVRDVASHLFSQVINFLVRAQIYYQKPRARPVRHLKVGFTPYAQKFDDIMELIQQYSINLEQEGILASELKSADARIAQEKQFELERQEFQKQEIFRKAISSQVNETCSDVLEIAESFQEYSLRHETNAVISWLQQLQPLSRLNHIPQKGTCLWIQESREWLAWVESKFDKPLWISGPPGSGKSTIAQYIFTHAPTKTTIVYFFQHTAEFRVNSVAFAAHVLCQLITLNGVKFQINYRSVINQISILMRSNRQLCNDVFDELWSIILLVISAVPDFTIIVDGLDECANESRNNVGLKLVDLATLPNSGVIVLFRHHPYLENLFRHSVKVDLTPAAMLGDIQTYVKEEIQGNSETLKCLEKEILDTVSNTAKCLFIWVKLMIDCLKTSVSHNAQLACLQNSPPGLFEFYGQIVSQSTEHLSSTSLICRRKILLILLEARESLTYQEFSFILSLKDDGLGCHEQGDFLIKPEDTIIQLCWPLVRVSNQFVYLTHATVKDFLLQFPQENCEKITSDESETFLALKCLATLSQEEYRSLSTIAILLRRNIVSVEERNDTDKSFYRYAATHWFVHVTSVRSPEPILIHQTALFLRGTQFVSWSEFVLHISGSQSKVFEVESKLKIWQSKRLGSTDDHLGIKAYFSGPYRLAAISFGEVGGDKILPYLPLFQLGEYYNLGGRVDEAFKVKKTVANGLIELLGERHPLALKAESALALEYFGQRDFIKAEKRFLALSKIQKEVLGLDKPDSSQSLQRAGMAELWMTKFCQADINLTQSLDGFLETVGPKSFLYLLSRLTLGQVYEYQGEINRSIIEYEHIWRYRVEILGPDNPMAVWARCAMVSGYRKLGRYDEADIAIAQVIESRTRTMGPKSSITIDAIIQRIVLYFDSRKLEDAMELIDFLLDGNLLEDQLFERTVQVEHVRGLLEFLADKIDYAIQVLKSLVDEASKQGESGRSRSLLWVLLDLATILRRKGREDEALVLFYNIVTPVKKDPTSSWVEAQGPDKLVIAEKALILVRELKPQDSDNLLEMNGLKWVRQEDFWILNGSPPADTGWMKRPF